MSVDSRQQKRQGTPSVRDSVPLELFDIDPNNLVQHFREQPKLVMDWGLKLADAKEANDRAKADLELTQAEATQEITENPALYGIAKTTADQIKSAVARHDDVLVAAKRLHRTKHEVDVYQAVMVALEHRKRTIEGLIELHGQQYYSVPSVSPKNREQMDDARKQMVRRRRNEDNND